MGLEMRTIMIIILSFYTVHVFAQEKSHALEQQIEQTQKAIDALDELGVQLNKVIHAREAECNKAIGYAPFCSCILKDLPVAWSFAQYVAITTKSKEENGYGKLSKEEKTAYDLVTRIRDRCVAKINAKH